MIKAIDVHSHFGSVGGFPKKGKEKELIDFTLEEFEKSYKAAEIERVFVSPADGIFFFGERTLEAANHIIYQLSVEKEWIYQWAVVHPKIPDSFVQAKRLLQSEKCVGIKIHPDAHGYHISEYGMKIFEFASRYHAIVETHSGDRLSPPEAFTVYGDQYPEVKILLSHLGNNCDGDVTHQVRAIQNSKNGNLFTDTSSMKSILPGLIEWAVSEVGSEHILLGTDMPLHHAGMMRSRVDYADLQRSDKENILYKNSEKIFFDV